MSADGQVPNRMGVLMEINLIQNVRASASFNE